MALSPQRFELGFVLLRELKFSQPTNKNFNEGCEEMARLLL